MKPAIRIGLIRDGVIDNQPRVQNNARALAAKGFEVCILCYDKISEEPVTENVTVETFQWNKPLKNKLFALVEIIPLYKMIWGCRIKRFIRKYKLDVLQVHDLYMLGAAFVGNRQHRLPLVANFHENYPEAVKTYNWTQSMAGRIILKLSNWKKVEERYLRRVDRVIVLSDTFKQQLLDRHAFLSPDQLIVYPNVPDLEKYTHYPLRDDVFNKGNEFIVLYFGNIAERRGIYTAIRAMHHLEQMDVKLMLIGPVDKADYAKFNHFLNHPELKNKIIHIPWIEMKLLPSYLIKADICISPIFKNPQHDSGVANKIFQYMLYEKPLVVSDSKEQRRIVQENKCGLVHKSDDAEDMARKLRELLEDEGTRERMGQNGKQAVLDTYNVAVQSGKLVDMYHELFR